MSNTLRVLITGAARGIGMATAQVLASRGHSVIATDVSAFSGSEGIQAHVLDVTSDDSVAHCLREVSPLDAIVNNAAISGGGPVEGYPLDRIRQIFETNTLGPLRIIQTVLPAWRKRGSGVIINMSSVSGRVASPLEAAYSASKFALEAFTESLHVEVRHFGIRCVLIEPGANRYRYQTGRPSSGTSRLRRTLGAVGRSPYQNDGPLWSNRTRSCRIGHRPSNRRPLDTFSRAGWTGR